MTRRSRYFAVTGIILSALSFAFVVWWLNYWNSGPAPVDSAQRIIPNACDMDSPNFDVATSLQTPLEDVPTEINGRISGKDYHLVLTRGTRLSEVIHAEGIVLEREDASSPWEESPMSAAGWLTRLLGSGRVDNIICAPLDPTHVVGSEKLGEVVTTKYVWAYSWHKKENTGTADVDLWTHRWEVWLDENGQMVQIRTSNKDPEKPFQGTEYWNIATSKILNVGEENVITKPTNN